MGANTFLPVLSIGCHIKMVESIIQKAIDKQTIRALVSLCQRLFLQV